MLTLKTLLLTSLLICSIASHDSIVVPNLRKVNSINIQFFKGKKTIYLTNKSIDLTYLKNLIIDAKNNPGLINDTTCEIVYLNNKTVIFKAYFCSRGTGSKYNYTGVVMFQIGKKSIKSLLNYGSAMLINEEFYQLNEHK